MGYTTIQLPTDFVTSKIDKVVDDKTNGFTSRANFVTEAVKAYLEKIKAGGN